MDHFENRIKEFFLDAEPNSSNPLPDSKVAYEEFTRLSLGLIMDILDNINMPSIRNDPEAQAAMRNIIDLTIKTCRCTAIQSGKSFIDLYCASLSTVCTLVVHGSIGLAVQRKI